MHSWDKILNNASTDVTQIIVTANNRLAKFLIDYFRTHILESDSAPLPTILPWNRWITDLCMQLFYMGKMSQQPMTKIQQQYLWLHAIKQQSTLCNESMLNNLQSALQLLKQWQLPIEDLKYSDNPDQQYFYETALSYQALCHEQQLQDDAGSLISVLNNLAELPLPSKISLVGFADYTPLQQSLINQFKSHGTHVDNVILETTNHNETYISYADCDQEFSAMAKWAFETAEENVLPLICVVPELHHYRSQVEYHFKKMQSLTGKSINFAIAGGDPLTYFPLIQTILHTLKMHITALPIENYINWLRSPYLLHAESEQSERLNLIRHLKRYYYRPINYHQYIQLIKQSNCEHLNNFSNQVDLNLKKQPIENVLLAFNTILESYLGLSQRDLSSHEYQLLQKWQQIYTECLQLSIVQAVMTPADLVHWLEKQAAQSLFQIEDSNNDIVILGILEATGMPAYASWVCQMSAQHWPMPAKPNPFLAYSIQNKYKFPHATALKQLDYAVTTRKLWQKNWQTIVYSYAQGEANMIRSSQLLNDLSATDATLEILPSYLKPISQESIWIDDTYGTSYQQQHVSGGASILKVQAECPFKAYAQYRLAARTINPPQLGFNALDKGNIIHTLLEKFWLKCKTSIQLQQLTNAEITEMLTEIYQQDITKQVFQHKVIHELEFKRATSIILKWIEKEKNRPPFSIASIEAKCQYTINNMTFNLRLDRIDKLQNDQYLIIDYKTSKLSLTATKWQTPRLAEPQLPMYALAYGENCHAIAFITLNAKNQQIRGISNEIGDIAGVKSINWDQQIEAWIVDIKNLVEQFQNGYAAVDPKRKQTCLTCDLQSICGVLRHEQ